jgi:predicted RNase H-like HicB family nuclease
MYRVGFPFWKTLARSGVTLKLVVHVMHDQEAGVFVATSDDLRGLVAEAATIEALVAEVKNVMDDLLTEEFHTTHVHRPIPDMRLCVA